MSNIEFTKRRKSKAEKRFYAQCSDCNDFEWYPMVEHRRWHQLYDYLEGAEWTMDWVSDELQQMLGYKVFTYSHESKTQDGRPIFSFKLVRRASSHSEIVDAVSQPSDGEA